MEPIRRESNPDYSTIAGGTLYGLFYNPISIWDLDTTDGRVGWLVNDELERIWVKKKNLSNWWTT
jgi:hypothetical protein